MKTIPFDLQKAMDGAQVVTRAGHEVSRLTYVIGVQPFCLQGYAGIALLDWTREGKRSLVGDTDADLVLMVKPKVRWLNIYDADVFDSQTSAEDEVRRAMGFLVPRLLGRAVPVEIEGGAQ